MLISDVVFLSTLSYSSTLFLTEKNKNTLCVSIPLGVIRINNIPIQHHGLLNREVIFNTNATIKLYYILKNAKNYD